MSDVSVKELKKIAYDVINEEIKNSNLEFSVFPLTFVEYYSDYVFKGNFSLSERVSYSLIPVLNNKVAGFNDLRGHTVIFLNRINKVEKIEGKLFRLLNICYHELRHSMQDEFDSNSYDKFLIDIERFIQQFGHGDYYMSHDKYSYEIGANLYSITKSKEYLRKKYPDLYEKEKEEIEKVEKRFYLDYLTYDASDVFNRFLKIIRLKNFKYGRNGDINYILGVFLDEDNNFRPFNKIISNKKFSLIDKRIVATVFSSETFLQEVKMDYLSISDLKILYDSLEYMDTIYNNQARMIEEKLKDFADNSKQKRTFLDKVKYFKFVTIKKVISRLNFVRNNEERLEHINDVSVYKNDVNKLIKRKSSRGFLIFNLFFIVLFICLLLTFILLYLYS